MFRLDMSRIVDATVVGAMARFMNHCCQPNAYAKIITVDTELGMDKKIAVFANRDISAGEEITYDYKVSARTVPLLFSFVVTITVCSLSFSVDFLAILVSR